MINFDEKPEPWIEIPKEWYDRTFDLVPVPVLSHPQQRAALNVYDPYFAQPEAKHGAFLDFSDMSNVVFPPSDSHAEPDAEKDKLTYELYEDYHLDHMNRPSDSHAEPDAEKE